MTSTESRLPEPALYLMSYPRSGSNWLFGSLAFLLGSVKAEARISPELFPHTYGPVGAADKFWVQAATPWKADRPLLVKSHESVATFAAIYPPAKTLYLLRDGRDALLSYYFYHQAFVNARPDNKTVFPAGPDGRDLGAISHNPVGFDAADFIEFLARHAGDWLTHAETWLAAPCVFVVRYENLQRDFAGELARITAFLELPLVRAIDDARREYVEKTAPLLRGDNQAFHRKGIVGDWKNYAGDAAVRAALKHHLGAALISLGYEKNSDW